MKPWSHFSANSSRVLVLLPLRTGYDLTSKLDFNETPSTGADGLVKMSADGGAIVIDDWIKDQLNLKGVKTVFGLGIGRGMNPFAGIIQIKFI